MADFVQAIAMVFLGLILVLVLDRQSRDLSLLLSLAVCCGILAAAAVFLGPVVSFLEELRRLGKLDSGFLTVLLKAAGIGFLAELSALICGDAGHSAMGKAVQILSNAAILWISLPLMRELVTILEEVLGAI